LYWLTAQTSELAYPAFASHGLAPEKLALLRAAFGAAAKDPDFFAHSTATSGARYNSASVEKGQAIV
jgi:hypothetical protein